MTTPQLTGELHCNSSAEKLILRSEWLELKLDNQMKEIIAKLEN